MVIMEYFFLEGIAKVKSQKCARVLFFLNCITPGLGTIFSAFLDTAGQGVHVRSLAYGFFQMMLALAFMLGWFWSIYHGFLICTHCNETGSNFTSHDDNEANESSRRIRDVDEQREQRLLQDNNEPPM